MMRILKPYDLSTADGFEAALEQSRAMDKDVDEAIALAVAFLAERWQAPSGEPPIDYHHKLGIKLAMSGHGLRYQPEDLLRWRFNWSRQWP